MKKSLTELLDETFVGTKTQLAALGLFACRAKSLTKEEFNREGDHLDYQEEDLMDLFMEFSDAIDDLKVHIDSLESKIDDILARAVEDAADAAAGIAAWNGEQPSEEEEAGIREYFDLERKTVMGLLSELRNGLGF